MTAPLMDFETMVRRGLGRAVIYARENDISAHREFILYACLRGVAYDPQLSGDQPTYMADIIQATGNAEDYRRSLLDALATPSDQYDAQVYKILSRISDPEDEAVRSTLYNCVAWDVANANYFPADILVRLDGLSGFLFVLNQLEDKEIDRGDWWHIENLFEELEKKIGEPEAQVALDAAIAEHPTYSRYAEIIRVKREQPKWVQPSVIVPSCEEIAAHFRTSSSPPTHRVTRWGREADVGTVLKIASDFLAESDESRMIYYLRFFQERTFPLSPDRLLEIAEGEDENYVWLARWALSNVTHPSVRALALKLFRHPGESMKAVSLLITNFQDGDWELVLDAVLRELSDDECHRIEMDVCDLFQAHSSSEAKDTLLTLYERSPCFICRRVIVEHLQTLGPLPDWMIKECQYDAYERTRELVNAYTFASG